MPLNLRENKIFLCSKKLQRRRVTNFMSIPTQCKYCDQYNSTERARSSSLRETVIYNYTQLHFLCCHSYPILYIIRTSNEALPIYQSALLKPHHITFAMKVFSPQLTLRTENKIWKVFLLCISWTDRESPSIISVDLMSSMSAI